MDGDTSCGDDAFDLVFRSFWCCLVVGGNSDNDKKSPCNISVLLFPLSPLNILCEKVLTFHPWE